MNKSGFIQAEEAFRDSIQHSTGEGQVEAKVRFKDENHYFFCLHREKGINFIGSSSLIAIQFRVGLG